MVLLLAPREKFTEAGAIQLKIIDAMNLPVEILTPGHAEFRDWLVEGSPGDIVVDALFGTGLSRTIEGLTREVIDAINKCGRRVISIDIPSGLDCDTGQPLGIAIIGGLLFSQVLTLYTTPVIYFAIDWLRSLLILVGKIVSGSVVLTWPLVWKVLRGRLNAEGGII